MAILTLGISSVAHRSSCWSGSPSPTTTSRRRIDAPTIWTASTSAVILSTCNRVEVYANVANYHAGFLALKRLLAETRHGARRGTRRAAVLPLGARRRRPPVRGGGGPRLDGARRDADHAQVREALRRAEGEDARRPRPQGAVPRRASARDVGREQETSLGAAPDAFVALGADLAERTLGGLEDRDVVVVGAGQMAALAVKHLRPRGVGAVRILNRSLEHARALAERTNGRPR